MHILSAENISKDYGHVLFSHVNFGIDSQDKIALIGSNGAGKSTLAAILAGVVTPDTGGVTLAGEVRIHYLPQNPEINPRSTILREVFAGDDPVSQALYTYHALVDQAQALPQDSALAQEIAQLNLKLDRLGGWEMESNGKAALTRLGVGDFQRSTASLSGGEGKRIALARALITPCQLLILDEPTNHLDTQAILWLEDYLEKRREALLLITHDRRLLSRVSNRVLEVDRGQFLDCAGGYQKFLELKEELAEAQRAAQRKHRAALRRELTWLQQGAKARSTKEKIRKQKYQDLKEQSFLGEKAQVELDIPAQRLGKKVIELKDISKGYSGRTLLRQFSYTLLPRDRIGIVGPNGSGKSTLLDIISDRVAPDSGWVERGETVKIGYYRQQAQELDDNLRVIQYVEGIRHTVNTAQGNISAAKMLERFLFEGPQQWTYIRDLSGGQRRRLYLLGVLMEEPNVLLLDEPTNDLDIETLTVLEDYLEDFPGAVLAVSHDRWFLDKTMDHLLTLDGQGGVELYTGSFSSYLAQPEEKHQQETPKKNRPRRQKTKLSYKEQREYQELEQQIDQLQTQLDQLLQELNQGGDDYQHLQDLHQQTQALEHELEAKMERWLELQELKDHLAKKKDIGDV